MIYSLIACDQCGNPGPVGDDMAEARRLAAAEGWTTVDADSPTRITQDQCPRHAESGSSSIWDRPGVSSRWKRIAESGGIGEGSHE